MRKRILLVENDDDIEHIVSVIADGGGWELFRARKGEEAIEIWPRARPDLILLDLKLGQLDGVGVFQSHPPIAGAGAANADPERRD